MFELNRRVSESALNIRAESARLCTAVNGHISRILQPEMPLAVPELTQRCKELAEECHRCYRENADVRMEQLRDKHKRLAYPEQIIVMIYSGELLPLVRNWLASCDHHGIEVRNRTIGFTLDREAENQSQKFGIQSCFLDPDIYVPGGGSQVFGDAAFARTMFYKNAVVRDALTLGADILFQDVDLVWLQDPFPYLLRQPSDFQLMYDGPNPLHAPLYANTGFIHVRCNDATRAFYDTLLHNSATVLQCRSHQQPFNQILAHFLLHNVVSARVLPEETFLNGHLFNLKRGLHQKAQEWKKKGYVVHVSWTENREEKRRKIELFGFDYLQEPRL
ncbi:MAG: putative nucleotide-diphospho-sugar transferase [Pseudomonadota bacterium]